MFGVSSFLYLSPIHPYAFCKYQFGESTNRITTTLKIMNVDWDQHIQLRYIEGRRLISKAR